MYIGVTNFIDTTTNIPTSSLSVNSSYPIENIYDTSINKIMKTSVTGEITITAYSNTKIQDIYIGNFNKTTQIQVKVTDTDASYVVKDETIDLGLLFSYELYYNIDSVETEQQVLIHLDEAINAKIEITWTPFDSSEYAYLGLLWLGNMSKFGTTERDSYTDFRDYTIWKETKAGTMIAYEGNIYLDKTFKIFGKTQDLANLFKWWVRSGNRTTPIIYSGTLDTLTDMKMDSLAYGLLYKFPRLSKRMYTNGEITIRTNLMSAS